MTYLSKLIRTLAFTLFLFSFLMGQNYKRVAPKLPANKNQGVVEEAPEEAAPVPESDALLTESLKGILIFSKPEEILPAENLSGHTGIEVKDHPRLQEKGYKALCESYLSRPFRLSDLNRLIADTTAYYRKGEGYVVDVIAPEQEMTSGIIQLVVIQAKVGKVTVEGNRWFSTESISSEMQLMQGEPVSEQKLKADLDWVNSNPFRQADATLKKGDVYGESDIILKTQDRFPVRFFTGWEDSGNDLTADEREYAGFNWGDAFGLGHQMNYQYMASSDLDEFGAHSGSYIIPLPWRHRLTFFGSYAESVGERMQPGNVLLYLEGQSWQTSARYSAPLPQLWKIRHEVSGGYDYKMTNSNLEFGGLSVFQRELMISQFTLQYSAGMRDAWGETNGRASIFLSPGGMGESNMDTAYTAARLDARAQYVYGQYALSRTTRLPWDFSVVQEFTYQWASGGLLGSEQFGVGGYDTVRGYEEREGNGDEGWLLRQEIRTPTFSVADFTRLNHLLGKKSMRDQWQALLFWDYGVVSNRKGLVPSESPDNDTELSSLGGGLRITLNQYVFVRADYGFQLLDTQAHVAPRDSNTQRFNSRFHLGVTVSY